MICLLAVRKFPNTVSGIMQMALGIVENWCNGLGLSVNPDKTGLIAFTRKRKLEGFFEPRQGEEGSKLFGGLWRNVETGTQGVSLALHLCHKAVLYLRLLGMVAWLSHSQSQGETKQNPEIGLLRDNGGGAYHSYLCNGGAHLPPSSGVDGTV
jgi:hypothetical protein